MLVSTMKNWTDGKCGEYLIKEKINKQGFKSKFTFQVIKLPPY